MNTRTGIITGNLATVVGSVRLPNPVMTAAGTSGHGVELGEYGDLSALGAVVVKSLSSAPGPGTRRPGCTKSGPDAEQRRAAGPRPRGVAGGDLPALAESGARVVVSIWGQSVDDYARAAAMLAPGGAGTGRPSWPSR